MSVDTAVQTSSLTNDEQTLLTRVKSILPLIADLARADGMVGLRDGNIVRVLAHAKPHSIAAVYGQSLVGETFPRDHHPTIWETVEHNHYARRMRDIPGGGAPIQREVLPLRIGSAPTFGVLIIDTNLLESERLRRRNRVFQQVVRDLKIMAARGEPAGADQISPFAEFDGLLFADYMGVIRYMSGIATNLYRNIGYTESLIGKPLTFLETIDAELARQAHDGKRCFERELEESGRHWVKKAIPIESSETLLGIIPQGTRISGTLIAIHDDTDARERALELQVKTTMIKEVHHRVKNDLQTVAALLRMQARRVQTDEARTALGEAVNRILSIAVIHEFLSAQDSRIINIRDIAGRILNQMQSGVLDPSREISLKLKGPNIYLTARQATSCALVINELLQNALEHGYDQRTRGGTISLSFEDLGSTVQLRVHDDGRGLPDDFDLDHVDSLGLRIVRMLVTDNLKGSIQMVSDNGVAAIVNFPKIPLGGDEAWNEQE